MVEIWKVNSDKELRNLSSEGVYSYSRNVFVSYILLHQTNSYSTQKSNWERELRTFALRSKPTDFLLSSLSLKAVSEAFYQDNRWTEKKSING